MGSQRPGAYTKAEVRSPYCVDWKPVELVTESAMVYKSELLRVESPMKTVPGTGGTADDIVGYSVQGDPAGSTHMRSV